MKLVDVHRFKCHEPQIELGKHGICKKLMKYTYENKAWERYFISETKDDIKEIWI